MAAEVTFSAERWNGVPFTGSSIPSIKETIRIQVAEAATGDGVCRRKIDLWLGNSQLHSINYQQPADHLAPYWLRKANACPNDYIPLGISLPNASLQEHLVLAHYVTARMSVSRIIISLTFDDLREDGLRNEFASLLSDHDRNRLRTGSAGRAIIERAEAEWHTSAGGGKSDGGPLEGFVQKHVEDRLNAALSQVSRMWAQRANLQNAVLYDLYFARNALLGIKPTTVRKIIRPRYQRNIAALQSLLEHMRAAGIPALAYITPIRQNPNPPYDSAEYEAWKQEVAELAQRTGARLINLEKLVPDDQWGSYIGDEVDFMHFRGKGHQMLAEAVGIELAKVERGSSAERR
ncbi:MAG: SGNH/GDSL hydrolase family protein [Deltaproteobacteria bacterium]|nr:SGNH/GDSL hydrolase family protein [Deltaproteobacteria bacterium]